MHGKEWCHSQRESIPGNVIRVCPIPIRIPIKGGCRVDGVNHGTQHPIQDAKIPITIQFGTISRPTRLHKKLFKVLLPVIKLFDCRYVSKCLRKLNQSIGSQKDLPACKSQEGWPCVPVGSATQEFPLQPTGLLSFARRRSSLNQQGHALLRLWKASDGNEEEKMRKTYPYNLPLIRNQ